MQRDPRAARFAGIELRIGPRGVQSVGFVGGAFCQQVKVVTIRVAIHHGACGSRNVHIRAIGFGIPRQLRGAQVGLGPCQCPCVSLVDGNGTDQAYVYTCYIRFGSGLGFSVPGLGLHCSARLQRVRRKPGVASRDDRSASGSFRGCTRIAKFSLNRTIHIHDLRLGGRCVDRIQGHHLPGQGTVAVYLHFALALIGVHMVCKVFVVAMPVVHKLIGCGTRGCIGPQHTASQHCTFDVDGAGVHVVLLARAYSQRTVRAQ